MSLRLVSAIALGALLSAGLIGCASRSYSPLEAATPARDISKIEESAPQVVVIPQEPEPAIGLDNVDSRTAPRLSATNAPVVIPAVPTFGRGWIPLRQWADKCGVGPAERIVTAGSTSYRIATRQGVCKLTIGQRLAHWNDIAFWLGFAPQILHGEPYVNALDAEKTLLPLASEMPPLRGETRVVVLDPGHGGTDGGTRGALHQLEKNYTLDWALRTERLLTNAGWQVFLTRRSDIDVSLTERVAFADRVHADVFISLHFNSTYPQAQTSGIETYCLTPAGMPSTLSRGYADDNHVAYPNNKFDAANMALAFHLQEALVKETRAHDDGVKRARFMGVLRYQNRPAILIEGGFLSNPHDAANIESGAYREALARSVADAMK